MRAKNTTPTYEDLMPLARDMTVSLSAEDRNRRLVELVFQALPCDAVALLRLEGSHLLPVAAHGLSEDVFGRNFARRENPRLDMICSSPDPTRFPADSLLPDPYDGLVVGEDVTLEGHVHSCLGCPLVVEGELLGVLTIDALDPGAFDKIDDAYFVHLAELAGASLRTSLLMDALQERAQKQGLIARDLVRDAMDRRGSILIGVSETMNKLRREIDLVARSEFPVLVTGETGVGKEVVLRMLHSNSPRSEEALVYLNCAALPDSVTESELFGHTKGAFTGADRERPGKFSVADGASLFLDEIGELPLAVQPKLLRVLQEGEIQRVGSDETLRVDVRIFAATNRDLSAEVKAGRFRADLLHRLDVCRIEVPPLREHREDIPGLAGHFAERMRSSLGTGPIRFSPRAQTKLMIGDWPGNVRELENVLSRAVLRAMSRVVRGYTVLIESVDLGDFSEAPVDELPVSVPKPVAPGIPLREAVDIFQRERIEAAVGAHKGNWSAAARDLGLDRANLHHLAKRLGLK